MTYFFYITIINININSALSKAYILHKYFKMELQPQFLLISFFFFNNVLYHIKGGCINYSQIQEANCESASPLTKSPQILFIKLLYFILVNFLRGCECLITLIIQLNKTKKIP